MYTTNVEKQPVYTKPVFLHPPWVVGSLHSIESSAVGWRNRPPWPVLRQDEQACLAGTSLVPMQYVHGTRTPTGFGVRPILVDYAPSGAPGFGPGAPDWGPWGGGGWEPCGAPVVPVVAPFGSTTRFVVADDPNVPNADVDVDAAFVDCGGAFAAVAQATSWVTCGAPKPCWLRCPQTACSVTFATEFEGHWTS
jgi:hypothetical protein